MIVTFQTSDLDRFRDAILRRLGFRIDENGVEVAADALRQRMNKLRLKSVDDYLNVFETSAVELREIASKVTVSETYFFRIPEHYRALAETALPDRIEAAGSRRRLTVLSAGCSSGEEAYSAAIVMRERFRELQGWTVDIQGVDINPVVIARARQASYSEWSLRQTQPSLKARYFRRTGSAYQLDLEIREMANFQEGNLFDLGSPFWQRDAYDIVFLRNVLMYFGPDAAEAVVARVAECLAPGGYLFLGPAETLRGLSKEFHLCHTHECFYYQRRGTASPRKRAPRPAIAQPLGKALAPDAVAPVEPDKSWFETIRQASERIQKLSERPGDARLEGKPLAPDAAPAIQRSGWNVEVPLELLRQERFADALAAVHGMPSEAQEDVDVQLLRAVLLFNRGEVAEAEKACRALLAANELEPGAHYLTALCREQAGDRERAVEHDRIAAHLDPGFAMPRLHLGLMAKRNGDWNAARHDLRQAAALLAMEVSSRVLLFGGGFRREALVEMCRRELAACGGGD